MSIVVTILLVLLTVLGRIVDDIEAGEDIYSLCHKQSAEQDVSEEEPESSVEDAE